MVAMDGSPLSIVERTGFCMVINYLQPRFEPPCRKTIVNRIHMLREKIKRKVLQLGNSALALSFTEDLWSTKMGVGMGQLKYLIQRTK